MARVLVAIRFPQELKNFIDESCAKREVTITSFVVNACWGELEKSQGTRVVSTPSVDASSNVNETKAAFAGKPDMQALRDICAGKPIVVGGDGLAIYEEPERKQCSYQEYDEQSGETMRCGLREHSAKFKHGNWRKA